VHRKLLEVLVDPETGEPLHLDEDGGADPIEDGVLVSPSGNRYPIVGGVPRFVPGEVYSGSFGLQWNRFAAVQLDSATGSSYSRRRFEDETGWTGELTGTWIVDAGCGSGRFAEIAAAAGAEVLAVDLSAAVDAAAANLARFPNAHVVQADLRKLPFRAEAVGRLYSIGVLQHTPDPIASARSLVGFLAPGAAFALTVYARRPWTRLHAKYLVRPLTRRVEAGRLLRAVERAMPVLYPVTAVLFALPVLGRAFRFAIPVANYAGRRDLPPGIRYKESVLDTFDMLSPAHDHPVTVAELQAGLDDLAGRLEVVQSVPAVVRGNRVL
jgi:SAM-dependent methyltransferase/uncharacterized protein YbaR (Trm112 family)